MTQLLSYALPGIPFGCTFALVAIGLVLTYRSTGVFNFAFGAQAYLAALVYAILTEHGITSAMAGILVIVVLSPLLGILFDRLVFSRIASANVAGKTVAALGLMVGLPALASIAFGPSTRNAPPSLLFNVNNVILHVDGTPINGEQLSTVVVTLLVLAVLSLVLRKTSLGLSMRAAVESPRMLRLQGVASGRVTASAWAVSSAMAGLAGILLAPRYGQVSVDNYTFLLVGAIADSGGRPELDGGRGGVLDPDGGGHLGIDRLRPGRQRLEHGAACRHPVRAAAVRAGLRPATAPPRGER